MSEVKQADVAIVGGGIVGLATAYRLLQQQPSTKIVVLEKEAAVAAHQTGHNSGVLHSGIYYKPGSLRAVNCREGKLAMQEFCEQEGIAYELCGKVIVAVDESEIPRMQNIYERGQQNGVTCEVVDADRLHELEPHVAGVAAIHVPESGIVDYKQVCERLAEIAREHDAEILLNARVTNITERNRRVHVESTGGAVDAGFLVNCGGLYSDRLTKLGGQKPEAKIVPFRGEYFELKPEAEHLCRNLIYPVPDPSFPFLGVHFTRMVHGGVECGPNAVLAFAREGYTRWTLNLGDLADTLGYVGFRRMAWKHWRMGMGEMWRSFSKAAFVRALQRLMPEITGDMLVACPAGVRAQALTPEGGLVDDFLVLEHDRIVNVCNAPSPAATASLNIGKLVAEKVAGRLG